MEPDAESRLAIARTRLVMKRPFLGALALRLPLVAADAKWCATSATDARRLYYNRSWIESLSLEQVQFVLAHEALHCALGHFARRGNRVQRRWDLACDHAINPLLLRDGLPPPPGVLVFDTFEGMAAEEIYPYIDENSQDAPMDRHVYDGEQSGGRGPQPTDPPGGGGRSRMSESGDGQSGTDPDPLLPGGIGEPPPLSESEREALLAEWSRHLASAAQQARQAGRLSGLLARMVDGLIEPRLPWRAVLARYLAEAARDDYTYTRPSRREGDILLPSRRSSEVDAVIAVDTSGSVGTDELAEFIAEIDVLKAQVRARITLLLCDATLSEDSPRIFQPWEECLLPRQIKGGGGTSFVPVFDWVARQDQPPGVLVYFTDAHGDFPSTAPDYPVIWLIKGRREVPWGVRIQLN